MEVTRHRRGTDWTDRPTANLSYFTAAVCERGHILSARLAPGQRADTFCPRCGAKVHTKCPKCNVHLRGAPRGTASGGVRSENLRFCPECGTPQPWTMNDLERAKAAIDQHAAEQGFSAAETAALKSFADDVVTGTANEAQVSGARALLKKFGPAGTVLWSALTDLAAKTMAAMMKP